MTKYSGLLKAKLQELLTARGLPVDGTKEVLIERLEESDKIAAELDEDEDEVATEAPAAAAAAAANSTTAEVPAAPAEEKKPEEPESAPATVTAAADSAAATAPKPSTETPAENAEKKEEETKQEVTPETLKAAAIEHLTKKIARAQKFGEDQQASTLQAELARIEKFGVALDSAIARELGFAPPPKKKAHPAPSSDSRKQRPKPHKRPLPRHPNNSNNARFGRDRGRDDFQPGYRRGGYGNYGGRHTHNGRIYKTRY